MEIASGIHLIKIHIPDNPLEYLNCYLVEGTNGWLMIDTGWYTKAAFKELQDKLKDLNLSLKDISTIVVTHIHPDHFGLAGRIKQVSPKTHLLVHRMEANLIESRYVKFAELQRSMAVVLQRHGVPGEDVKELEAASMPVLKFVFMTSPDDTLCGGENIATGKYDVEVIWTPGHSTGHVCLYEPENQLLFSGDHILPTITSNIGYHVESGDNPLGDYICALHKLEYLPVRKVCPAHEGIFTDLGARVRELILHHDNRKTEIQKAIEEGYHTAYDISSHVKWNITKGNFHTLPPIHKRGAVTETIAHLECMRWEGRVTKKTKDGFISYENR